MWHRGCAELLCRGAAAPVAHDDDTDDDDECAEAARARYGASGTVRGYWNYPRDDEGEWKDCSITWLFLHWDNTDSWFRAKRVQFAVQWYRTPLLASPSKSALAAARGMRSPSPLKARNAEVEAQEQYRTTFNRTMIDSQLKQGVITQDEHDRLIAADAAARDLNTEIGQWHGPA